MWLRPHFEAAGNLLRFDRFMELALYDADHGYYSCNIESVGSRGDFATSATLSPLLARGIADWIRRGQPANVIEIGAGTGQLAAAILRELKRIGPASRLGLRRSSFTYRIVERSPVLEAAQRRLLRRRAVRWHRTIDDALAAANGQAFLFSNELVDAFPVRVFRHDNAWSELFLALRDGALVEVWQPVKSEPASSVFAHSWPAGQRVEVHESYRRWLSEWSPRWNSGELLTIDYGGSSSEIYRRQPQGTLRAYYRHERSTGAELYTLPGRRDLTADVNFDDLARWGEALGLATISLQTQREFLLPHNDAASATGADRYLLEASGPGTAFKVLRQRRA